MTREFKCDHGLTFNKVCVYVDKYNKMAKRLKHQDNDNNNNNNNNNNNYYYYDYDYYYYYYYYYYYNSNNNNNNNNNINYLIPSNLNARNSYNCTILFKNTWGEI